MESDRTYHYFFKYLFLVVGLVMMIGPALSFVFPDSVEINGKTGTMDFATAIIFVLLGLLSMLVFLLIKDKFAIVELRSQTLTIKQNREVRTLNWSDVASISQIQFVQPPLYKLKTKDSEEIIWFNTESKYVSFNGFTSDLSEMGELITKKKREFGI